MRRVFFGSLTLMVPALSAAAALAAPSQGSAKTIKDLADTIPLGVLKRTVGPKFYQSLLVSPLDDWSLVRARRAGGRLTDGRVVRPAANPAYNSLALKFASELTLVADDTDGGARRSNSALMHLLIYKIVDGVMAISFAYPEAPAQQQMKNAGSVRLSVKTKEGRWTEIRPSETQEDKRRSLHERGGPRLRRMDRMPMDVISVPRP